MTKQQSHLERHWHSQLPGSYLCNQNSTKGLKEQHHRAPDTAVSLATYSRASMPHPAPSFLIVRTTSVYNSIITTTIWSPCLYFLHFFKWGNWARITKQLTWGHTIPVHEAWLRTMLFNCCVTQAFRPVSHSTTRATVLVSKEWLFWKWITLLSPHPIRTNVWAA
jgi:hypothetical protein